MKAWLHRQVPKRRALWLLGSVAGVCLLLGWMVYLWPHDYTVQPEVKFEGYEWDRAQMPVVLKARFKIVNGTGGPLSFHELEGMTGATFNMTSGHARVMVKNDGDKIESLAADKEREVTVLIPWTPTTNAPPPVVEMRFAYWEGQYALMSISNFLPDRARDWLRTKVKPRIGRGRVVSRNLPLPEQVVKATP